MHHGSCLCGKVTYEVEGDFGDAYFCHCQRCRKATGTAFAANARIKPQQFRLLTGQDALKSFHHAPTGLSRKFCGECGSPIVSERAEPAVMSVRLGTLDTVLDPAPFVAHIFVGSKAGWDCIGDDLPQFAEWPVK
jgi:hypothetical protein